MAELARRAGIKQPSLWEIENQITQDPKASTLINIAAALGVPLQAILSERHQPGAQDLVAEMTQAFSLLRPTDQAALIAAARAMGEQNKKPPET